MTYYIGYNEKEDSFDIYNQHGLDKRFKCDERDMIHYTALTSIREILLLGNKIEWCDVQDYENI